MPAVARTPQRDRLAIAGSIAIHICVLTLAAYSFPRVVFSSDEPDERSLLANVLRIEHRAPHVAKGRQLTLTAAPPRVVAKLPAIHAVVAREHAARQLVVAREERASPPRERVPTPPPHHPTTPAPTVAAAEESSPVPGDARPSPKPVATPVVVAQREESGIGNFSESYPAAIDPALRGALFGGINGVIVRIAVDENGRATAVEFVRSPADPTQRDELRSRILATRFTPASCNGLRCSGSLELRN